jgi:transcriptional regulator with XRE-family HTH domain
MNLIELAQRIRRLRRERNLSIEETAARAGLTRSWLSKVESFRITPSLPALSKLAEVLQTTTAELVDGLDKRPGLVMVRSSERLQLDRDAEISSIKYESLGHKRSHRNMDPLMLEIPAGGGRDAALAHGGEEFLIVFDGKANFEYEGQVVTLNKGDCLYFDGAAEHRLFNPYRRPARVLCVFFGLEDER